MASLHMPNFNLRHRSVPDVPEDIDDDLLEHLNDPNYELRSLRSTRSRDSVAFDGKDERTGKAKSFSGESFDYSDKSDIADMESQVETTTRGAASTTHMQEIHYNDESPYPEVRAAVSSIDDPLMPVNTIRMWTVGVFFVALISLFNQVLMLRYPSVVITGVVVQLLSLPVGKAWQYVVPNWKIAVRGYSVSLNPGPFNIKEHTVITVMSSVVVYGAYATDVIATQRVFYGQNWSLGYQYLLCLSTQLIGYGLAGLARPFLVWPSSMIWPGALVNSALFNTLHKNYDKRETKHMSRHRFFLIVFICSFVWAWFPSLIFTALSVANWVCWIAPNNVPVNQMFGTLSGLGMGVITLDWSMVTFIGSPLVVPWWAEANTFVSFVFWFWIICPILYYKNVFFSKFLPISGTTSFDRFGQMYDPTAIVKDGQFDLEGYKNYSPLFMPITLAISYACTFAGISAVLVHVFLWYRRDIKRQFRRSIRDERDVHSRLMLAYKEVPHWWYMLLFTIAFCLGVAATQKWETHLPMWAYILAIVIGSIFIIPLGIIQAITNQTASIMPILQELLIGYMYPGRPVAMMIYKTYGLITVSQALAFSGDLKLGHYMKIPPRIMFTAQVVATTISVFICVSVQAWMFENVPGMCEPDQKNGFICASTSTFATASLIWGGIGPKRLFSKGGLYYPLIFFFLIGALSPIPFYYAARRWPRGIWRYINMPVFWNGIGAMPPASGINYASWLAVGFVFQWFARRFHFRWWMRHNYILSAGLDSGVAVALVCIFFFVVLPSNNVTINWWGNTVWQNNADAMGTPAKLLAEGETFGPATW